MPSAPAEAEPRPTRAGHTPLPPRVPSACVRPELRSPDSCGRGRGRAPPRQAQPPLRGRGSGKDVHLPPARDAGDPEPRCPHAYLWPRPSPTARPESPFRHCGTQQAQPWVPSGPHPSAPRATWRPPAWGEGWRGHRGWGRPHLRHGRVTVAGGSRVPAGADRGRPGE